MDVVVADGNTHRVGGDDHALDHDVRVELQDVAVFASTWLTFVGVADQVLLTWELTRHEAPLQTGGEARATTAAQARFLDRGNDLILRQAFSAVGAQDLAQSLITATGLIVLQAPVVAIEVGIDLSSDVATMKTGLDTGGLELGKNALSRGHHFTSAARRPSIS